AWSAVASAPSGQGGYFGSSGTGPDGKFYIAGGTGSTFLNRAMRYDPSSDSWGMLNPLIVPVTHSNGGFANGLMHAIGGDTFSDSGARCPGIAGYGVCDYTQQLDSADTNTPTSTS